MAKSHDQSAGLTVGKAGGKEFLRSLSHSNQVGPGAPVHGPEQGTAAGLYLVDQKGQHGQGCKQIRKVPLAATVIVLELVATAFQRIEDLVLFPASWASDPHQLGEGVGRDVHVDNLGFRSADSILKVA